uniref:PPM-type phosphatase domain-containing protein n=1 Tax=Aplanochytrium stocchinoi TaxID=215587 RepID=A0A7S3LR51_9STRA|mmetsp:Transcript_7268/g.9209  ORF Transcript_7268/g.9209 Transcript_7268/m.9209 type:complete len:327 (-) Transcript_7268:46-1026(-)
MYSTPERSIKRKRSNLVTPEPDETDEINHLAYSPRVPIVCDVAEETDTGFVGGLEYGWIERVGQRYKGEDLVYVSNQFAAVFDGHRGRDAAEFCAEKFPVLLKEGTSSFTVSIDVNVDIDSQGLMVHKKVKTLLQNSFIDCHEAAKAGKLKSGTTAVIFYLYHAEDENQLYGLCANAGDSRCVLSVNGKAVRLSKDHKASSKEETERIIKSGGEVIFGQLEGMLEVSRGIGDFDMEPGFIADPHISDPIQIPDTANEFVILATDGLWDVVDDQTAVKLVKAELDKGASPASCASKLADVARDRQTRDDTAVLVISFNTKQILNKSE